MDYLLSEDEDFFLQAQQTYRYKGVRNAKAVIADVSALFASGQLSEQAKDAVIRALQDADWMTKKQDHEKYTPKKQKKTSEESND